MNPDSKHFSIRIARGRNDFLAAHRLRYRVFVEELGGNGPLVDHEARLECDEFDNTVDHLLLIDNRRDPARLDHVIGVYRLFPGERATQFGRFYCDSEFDLSRIKASGRSTLELGRSCILPEYRGGSGMYLLWNALSEYVLELGIEILFGVASFHGTNISSLTQPLSWLHHKHLAPEELRPVARSEGFQNMNLLPKHYIDRKEAMIGLPPLIKAYLRLGGTVGEGAFIDHEFNTTDVLLLMDTKAMSSKHRNFYTSRWQSKG